jgi:hypothetical protein
LGAAEKSHTMNAAFVVDEPDLSSVSRLISPLPAFALAIDMVIGVQAVDLLRQTVSFAA